MENVAIVYDSKTGNVQRFMKKFPEGTEIHKIGEIDIIDKPFVLVTYTTGYGMVPPSTTTFLENNHQHLKGVASSGSRNWGDKFAMAATKVSTGFNCPVIALFELSGSERVAQDILNFMEAI